MERVDGSSSCVSRADGDGASEVAVSVVVPFYNAKDHFAETLDSIANQDLDCFEVLLVDDGSSDGSARIAKEYASQDARFKYYRQENKGAGAARNNGMMHACGEYVTFLDADDLFESDFLSKMYKAAVGSSAEVTVCGADIFASETEEKLGDFGVRLLPGAVYETDECARRLMQIFTTVPWNKLFSSRFIIERGLQFQELVYSNDNFFVVSALAESNAICLVAETLVHYRIGTGSSLRDNMVKDPLCDIFAMDAVYERLCIADSRSEDLLASFREWAAGLLYATARDLILRDEGSARVFYETYFGKYHEKWGVSAISYEDVVSRRRLWLYRRFCNSSLEGFAWACRRNVDNRVSRYQRPILQRALFASRLLLASVFTRSASKTTDGAVTQHVGEGH